MNSTSKISFKGRDYECSFIPDWSIAALQEPSKNIADIDNQGKLIRIITTFVPDLLPDFSVSSFDGGRVFSVDIQEIHQIVNSYLIAYHLQRVEKAKTEKDNERIEHHKSRLTSMGYYENYEDAEDSVSAEPEKKLV